MLSSGVSARPLDVAEFGDRLGRLACFETAPFLAVAVSGGPDSLALAIVADRWARLRGGAICALTVDHGLRPESGAEARRLGGWLTARAIRHEILDWSGAKPASGIQQAARAARYRLLARWCRAHGCLHLLTAHHRDDQAETHLIRRAAHSGADGLAGMSAIRELESCRILRPLLAIGKARLIATLEVERQQFITDPSNRDYAFARGRLRAGEGGGAPDEVDALLDAVSALGRERAARERAADAVLARAATLHPAGFACIDPCVLLAAAPEIGERAIAAAVAALGGGRYPPRRRRTARLLRVLAGDAHGSHTLGGCRFIAWRGRILVLRELAAAAEPVEVAPGASLVWDRRFAVTSPSGAARPATLGYLGRAGAAELGRRAPALLRRAGLPPLIQPILPALRDEEGIAAVPHLGYRREGVSLLPKLAFRPVNSLSRAGFAVV